MYMKVRDKTIDTNKSTRIMGIVNVTPDSFSGDGIVDPARAIVRAHQLLNDGADIVDIGGESTKPGSSPVSEALELHRIMPIIDNVLGNTSAIVSVDTYKTAVAQAVLQHGVHIINDVTGLHDPEMAPLIASYKAGLVIMHMQGKPKTMQQNPHYDNVIEEINSFFQERIQRANEADIPDDHIIVDPGIGFGKTLEHNLTILRNLSRFKRPFDDDRQFPILIGTSRKTFIGKLIQKDDPKDRVFGTAASVALAIANGANIVRVHDVAAMHDVVRVADAIRDEH